MVVYEDLEGVYYYELTSPCNYDWCAMLIIYRPPRRATTVNRVKSVPAIGVTNATISGGRYVFMPMADIDTHVNAWDVVNRVKKLFPGKPYLVQRTGRGIHVFVANPVTNPNKALALSVAIPPRSARDNGWTRVYRLRIKYGLSYMGVIRIAGKYEKPDIETVDMYAPEDKPESNWIINIHRAYKALLRQKAF